MRTAIAAVTAVATAITVASVYWYISKVRALRDVGWFNGVALPNSLAAAFRVDKLIGSGITGVVASGSRRSDGLPVAVKIIERKIMRTDVSEAVSKEICVMQTVNHPNIIRIYDVFATKSHVFIVMERAFGGELFERIQKLKVYTESNARNLMVLLVDAVAYLHSMGIIHRDLKPENLLLASEDDDVNIKICDFGLSKITNESTLRTQACQSLLTESPKSPDDTISGSSQEPIQGFVPVSSPHPRTSPGPRAFAEAAGKQIMRATTVCGTPEYLAPEVMFSTKGYTEACDMWSLGVILHVMLTGRYPAVELTATKQAIIWRDISAEAKDILTRLLDQDPDTRMTPQEFKAHPWIRAGLPPQPLPSAQEGIEQHVTARRERRERTRRRFRQLLTAVRFIRRARNSSLGHTDDLSTAADTAAAGRDLFQTTQQQSLQDQHPGNDSNLPPVVNMRTTRLGPGNPLSGTRTQTTPAHSHRTITTPPVLAPTVGTGSPDGLTPPPIRMGSIAASGLYSRRAQGVTTPTSYVSIARVRELPRTEPNADQEEATGQPAPPEPPTTPTMTPRR